MSRFAHRERHAGSISGLMRHYDDPDRVYHITVPRQQFQLGGYQLHDPTVPRGRDGIDALEADVREQREVMAAEAAHAEAHERQRRHAEQRDALEWQLAQQRAARDEARAAELEDAQLRLERAPFGPA